jgi:hypothetical protein
MLVIAHHFVQDANAFWSAAKNAMETSSIPQSLVLHSVFPSTDGQTGTCVWEAESPGDVQEWLDNTFGDSAKNVTYQVDEKEAYGLPKKSAAAASLSL